ncbi:hypothetical protein Pan241w_52320 [Gimesia alba]|uniref:Uncharacterized protein n=1 Tax=Gimesia alba TaxID=2527973 RepID=A0A517RMM6_9PLAN|nr:hypothetical protein [Gimesia alba]QDT45114.1 hypothetical protein Pan241w_52320 [Gimesia alba]
MKRIRPIQHQTGIRVSVRRGSTLLIVIALLAMLSLLGVVFYTFSAQERTSAEYFAEASLNVDDIGFNPDVYYDWALEQLIIGPGKDKKLYNSALWSRRHSMIPNMFGMDHTNDKISDAHPYSGEGINLILNSSAAPAVDQDYNGTPDNAFLLNYNLSPAAQETVINSWTGYPEIDVNYTAPDINNMFLAYNGFVPGPNWPANPDDFKQVIIPSFHRPQYLRTSAAPVTDWYVNSTYAKRVFRPHADHVFVPKTGVASSTPRFDPALFPGVPLDGVGVTSTGKMGIWTGDGDTEYFLDVDNDGDGIREGIWMDLDFPPIENPSIPGSYVIPLFSFTVYDLDGLIGLNTAGNMRQPGGGSPTSQQVDLNYAGSGGKFGDNETGSGPNQFLFLSRSNLGLSSPGEINPQYALYAQPPTTLPLNAVEQHRNFFGDYPSSWAELSNMEYFFLKFGRPIFSSGLPANTTGTFGNVTDLAAGVWGETNLLYNAQRPSTGSQISISSFPRPGKAGVDDNNDRFEGSHKDGTLQTFAGTMGVNVPGYGSPISFNGAGRGNKVGSGAGDYRQPDLRNGGFGGPGIWPHYTNQEVANPNSSPFVRWPASLFSSSVANESILTDDADEIIVNRDEIDSVNDTILGPDELAFLHLSGSDITNAGVTSRLGTLLPYNFGSSSKAQEIRKKFTTISWDRKQFGKSKVPGFRNWETASSAFPPTFGGTDPFRPELRALLSLSLGGINQNLIQQKLNVNELLVYEETTLAFRPLTPHPGEDYNENGILDGTEDLNQNGVLDALTSTEINQSWGSGTLPSYPPTNAEQKEFWARYDRQRMARDIYVLLYVLGGGKNIDYSQDNSSNALYTDAEMKQMAQFAVNMVDALDRDDVLTRFEYDTNLSDGWGLNDNPYQNTSDTDRAEVWGVEAQKLTLSEFILVQCDDQMSDHAVTQFPDDKVDGSDRERFFTAIELRNNSPAEVSFGTEGKWRIGLEVDGSVRTYAIPKNRKVAAGGLFTLLSTNAADTSNGSDPYSEFRVDLNGNSDFNDAGEQIIPSVAIAGTAKIDIVNDQATTNSLVTVLDSSSTDLTGTTGSFLDSARTELSATSSDIKVKLYRKAHLGRNTYLSAGVPVPDPDNPWVLVDEMAVPKSEFSLTMDTAMEAQAQLDRNAMKSQERSQPLYKRNDNLNTIGTGNNIRNTIGQKNSRTTATYFDTWQPHFDRNFASIAELLSIPLCGPDKVTEQLVTVGGYMARNSAAGTDPEIGDIDTDDINVAGIQKFLDPDGPDDSATTDDDNRWYRLFEYIEVPTRLHRHLGNPLEAPRVAGKLNLNTIRHPSVLAALIDDMGTVANTTSTALNIANYTTDVTGTRSHHPRLSDRTVAPRDWWLEYLLSRDSVTTDSTSGAFKMLSIDASGNLVQDSTRASQTGYIIPGLPGTRPFKSLDTLATNGPVSTLRENGILRSLPLDLQDPAKINNPRGLFEVASWNEHAATSSAPKVDYFTRNRILSKIMGNTTTRSNTFIVFVSVALFDADGPGLTVNDGVVQIGARSNGSSVNEPDYRGFFVIDRTRAEDAFNGTSEKFENWRRLIRYRLHIQ